MKILETNKNIDFVRFKPVLGYDDTAKVVFVLHNMSYRTLFYELKSPPGSKILVL